MKPKTNTYDSVECPSHYCSGSVEVIDVIRQACSCEEVCGFYLGNILKYVLRYKKKNGVEDLKKARKYLDWLIEERSKEIEN